ncbi:unnamed protein product (macronuclear) [Paramecium tetraurelia]|uniref:Transmembrane protein n=1 Tax=Paramecium tetraurelia TaxID=5888 RepID=A0E6N2_PARTE|nr:uncharacterized protein GSPATT00003814001 [Paramecium tetraurelia]CAK90949.1 unnamed protein product [Paramecium tetraurelia]|eukprot:XP_001458346.1 hypothetical protein (macronuclear) [Paramecium tetraurelia strain d4-2]
MNELLGQKRIFKTIKLHLSISYWSRIILEIVQQIIIAINHFKQNNHQYNQVAQSNSGVYFKKFIMPKSNNTNTISNNSNYKVITNINFGYCKNRENFIPKFFIPYNSDWFRERIMKFKKKNTRYISMRGKQQIDLNLNVISILQTVHLLSLIIISNINLPIIFQQSLLRQTNLNPNLIKISLNLLQLIQILHKILLLLEKYILLIHILFHFLYHLIVQSVTLFIKCKIIQFSNLYYANLSHYQISCKYYNFQHIHRSKVVIFVQPIPLLSFQKFPGESEYFYFFFEQFLLHLLKLLIVLRFVHQRLNL